MMNMNTRGIVIRVFDPELLVQDIWFVMSFSQFLLTI